MVKIARMLRNRTSLPPKKGTEGTEPDFYRLSNQLTIAEENRLSLSESGGGCGWLVCVPFFHFLFASVCVCVFVKKMKRKFFTPRNHPHRVPIPFRYTHPIIMEHPGGFHHHRARGFTFHLEPYGGRRERGAGEKILAYRVTV